MATSKRRTTVGGKRKGSSREARDEQSRALEALFRIAETVGRYGGYQAFARDPQTGVYAGATESRKDGCALGY